jgi:hypothetical protein
MRGRYRAMMKPMGPLATEPRRCPRAASAIRGAVFRVLVDLLGVAMLFGLIAAAAWYVYKLQVLG